ncbi:DUF2853 family protein [Flavobacterium sp. LB2P44]|uniref:DUF2853 family protein n=1 Tax=Flavobacterium sp. LB2P44 TaxID=3401713 RepID=UPI003AAB7157
MSARDELTEGYTADFIDKCVVNPDIDLLTKVTIGCGPSIYKDDLQHWPELSNFNWTQ